MPRARISTSAELADEASVFIEEDAVEAQPVKQLAVIGAAPALEISPMQPVALQANIGAMVEYLKGVNAKYQDVDFAALSLQEVAKTKSAMRSLRTDVEKSEKTVKSVLFDTPKKAFTAELAPVYSLIAAVEDRCDEVLKVEEEVRVGEVNKVIDIYIKSAQAAYNLNAKYGARIERKKAFYNKTQDEADTRSDINDQFEKLSRAQKAEESAVRLITNTCKQDVRLDLNVFLRSYERSEDVAQVVEEINKERERLASFDQKAAPQPAEPKQAVSPAVNPLLKAAEGIDLGSDLPERTKTITVEITYPCDMGKALTELFAMLSKHGVRSRNI